MNRRRFLTLLGSTLAAGLVEPARAKAGSLALTASGQARACNVLTAGNICMGGITVGDVVDGSSNLLHYLIAAHHEGPRVSLDGIFPPYRAAGDSATTTLIGHGFASGMTADIGGASQAVTVASSTQATITPAGAAGSTIAIDVEGWQDSLPCGPAYAGSPAIIAKDVDHYWVGHIQVAPHMGRAIDVEVVAVATAGQAANGDTLCCLGVGGLQISRIAMGGTDSSSVTNTSATEARAIIADQTASQVVVHDEARDIVASMSLAPHRVRDLASFPAVIKAMRIDQFPTDYGLVVAPHMGRALDVEVVAVATAGQAANGNTLRLIGVGGNFVTVVQNGTATSATVTNTSATEARAAIADQTATSIRVVDSRDAEASINLADVPIANLAVFPAVIKAMRIDGFPSDYNLVICPHIPDAWITP